MSAFNTPAIQLPSVVVVPNNETVAGTFSVAGAVTASSTVSVKGAVTASSTVSVTGLLTPNGGIKTPLNLSLYSALGGF